MFLDIFIAIVLLVSTVIAFMRGFMREALTLVSITVTLAATFWGGPLLRPAMDNAFSVGENSEKIIGILPRDLASLISAYGIIFIVLIIAFTIASHLLSEFIKSLGLGSVDRSLGALFGLIRGILLMSVLYMPFHFILDNDTKTNWFSDSKSYVYLENASLTLAKLLPTDMIQNQNDADETEDSDTSPSLSTKEKLQAINVLKDNIDNTGITSILKTVGDKDNANETGYNDDFRNEISDLIKKNNQPTNFNE